MTKVSTDAQLAAGLVQDPAGGLGPVYDAYSAKLYTYALTMLRDPATAQDVVHDSLLVAAGSIGQLRDPARLRPWLYAITRNECLRTLRGRKRFSDSDETIDMPDTSVDFDAGLRREEAARLVGQAMAAMSPADRDIVALALQHDLDVERLSQITGAKPNVLHAQLSRARAGLSDAVSALVLYRARGKDCETLAAIVAPADQPLSPLLRKRILRHVKDCDICERRRHAALAALRPAMAAPMFVSPPPELLSRIQHSQKQGQAVPLTARAAPLDADGFPRPLGRRSRSWLLPAAAAISALVLVLIGLAVMTTRSDTDEAGQAFTGSAVLTPQPSVSSSASAQVPQEVPETTPRETRAAAGEQTDQPEATQSSSAPLTPRSDAPTEVTSAKPKTSKTQSTRTTSPPKKTTPSSAAPQPAAPQPPAQPPAITGIAIEDLDTAGDGSFTRCDSFTLRVTASVTGEVNAVRAVISPANSVVTLTGSPHVGTVTLPPGDYTVSVEATGPGGTTTRDGGSVLHICPG